MGLGLAIVNQIIRDHNGSVRIENNKPPRREIHHTIPRMMSNEKILIIDDEASIRSSLQGILEDEGFAVKAVETGEAGAGGAEKPELRPRPPGYLAP